MKQISIVCTMSIVLFLTSCIGTNNNAGKSQVRTSSQHAESYCLFFNANGGVNVTGGIFASPDIPCGMDQNGVGWVQVTIGAPYFSMENECPTRSGYRFRGWYDAPEGGEKVYNSRGICVEGKYWKNNCWHWHGSVVLYAHWQEKTSSQQMEMTTMCNPMVNGHEYVDLGLSVKWATCNVGANEPEEYGDYYAWGEVLPKDNYTLYTNKYNKRSHSFAESWTKYCTKKSDGTVDNKTTLEAMDDAAAYNWGGSWRMPTDEELDELKTQCTWTWTTRYGISGYEVKSKSNGNAIFLPAAGYCENTYLRRAGSRGYYWTSSLYENLPSCAISAHFYKGIVSKGGFDRDRGRSVRPVCP